MTPDFNLKNDHKISPITVNDYNTLPTVTDAREQLQRNLGCLDFGKDFLLCNDICKLFLEGAEARRFGIFVAHRPSILLEEGERIVTSIPVDIYTALPRDIRTTFSSITLPRPKKWCESRHIVATSWVLVDGKFMEYEYNDMTGVTCDHYPSPPSPSFLRNFHRICSEFGLTGLGLFSLDFFGGTVDFDNLLVRESCNGFPRGRTTRWLRRVELEGDMVPEAWVPGSTKEPWLVGRVEDLAELKFNYQSYNRLHLVQDANQELRRQIMRNDGWTKLCDFFQTRELRRLFLDGQEACRFGLCLVHRHHALHEGERMVMSLQVDGAESVTISSPNRSDETTGSGSAQCIAATSWMLVGGKFEEFEHKLISQDEDHTRYIPPSRRFFSEFLQICQRYHIDILGIFSMELPFVQQSLNNRIGVDAPPDFSQIFLETTDQVTREHRTRLILRSDTRNMDTSQSAWILSRVGKEHEKYVKAVERNVHIEDENQIALMEVAESNGDQWAPDGDSGLQPSDATRRVKLDMKKFWLGSNMSVLDPLGNDGRLDVLSCGYTCQNH
ncbi:hypothetical protein JR316_0009790 [Psilocybe cubensis]|uniref:Uncharacterized protein n=2 Tax=Psilocybe cubensis TaxID=181762 RepID=A0A8H7XQ98_PSICU|nr:hypothetical protein JR316_0009790 [Psilocybe cubensis]KAH9477568.1 hypothetical protein JR316_0009790 [Psilocybe cubensis]